MKDDQDAFGHGMLHYFNTGEGVEIIERDDGYFHTSSGPASYFAEYAFWPEHHKQAMKFAHGRVLDIGCGAGRHTLYLQEQGLEVTAVDSSPKAIEVCRLRGVKDARILPITKISRHIEPFDSIIMMGNNFGLFANAKRAKRLLKRFHHLTFSGGTLMAESADPYQTEDVDHLAYHQFNRQRGRMSGQLRLRVRHRRIKTPWFDYLIVSREEMAEIVQGTGWKIAQFIDSDSPMYVAILEKEQAPT